MRKLLVLFFVAAVALSVGGAFGDPPPEEREGPFSNPPCVDEDGNGPDHGHPNENSPKCTGELPNGDPFPPGNGNGNGNGNGDNGCPPATGPISSNLQPLGDADPTGAVNVVLCILSDLGI